VKQTVKPARRERGEPDVTGLEGSAGDFRGGRWRGVHFEQEETCWVRAEVGWLRHRDDARRRRMEP
jgi:hypothetical protein